MHKSASDGDLKRHSSPVSISHVVPSKQIKLGTAIERGSFGVVRRARWLRSIVAVKVLPTIKSAQMMAFLKEMSFACGLRHPNIVATMGAVTDKYCALIMELMPWGSLKASLNDPRRRQFFDYKKMIRGMMSSCRAGAYLASVNVIHRDISSKNVFVSAGFESMKLGDFGYSSLLDEHIKDREDPEYVKNDAFGILKLTHLLTGTVNV
jgi:serine/threonine protein kinase